jgi:hypothetical protein
VSTQSRDPRVVFRSALPTGTSLIVVFVPSKDRNGDAIDQDYWVDEVLTTLGRLFRGATAYPHIRGARASGGTMTVAERCSPKSR